MAESRQWGRVVEVIIGKAGRGLSISDLHISFEIEKTADSTPNKAVVKIRNLNPSNEEKIKHEYDEVIINAGYKDSVKLLFRGDIRHVYRYFEKGNAITEIEAGDGEKDLRTTFVNETIAAGATTAQMVGRIVDKMPGTNMGYVQITDFERPRGRVMSGGVRDVLDDLAYSGTANWSVQDGVMNMVQQDQALPEVAIVLDYNSGLIGTPEVNENGVSAVAQLNPNIKIYGLIKLDNNNIKELRQKKEPLVPLLDEMGEPQKLDPDGVYKVTKLIHRGDTHGKDWMTVVESVALKGGVK